MTALTFSVIMPVHNGEPYVAAALESVLKQTYQNFRVLVLENASDDHTLEIIQSFSDPRITVFPAPKLLTIEANWARILDLNLDEYMVTLCHDDLFYPDFLSEIAHLIEATPDAGVYQTQFELIDERSAVIRKVAVIPAHETADEFVTAFHQGEQFGENVTGTGYVVRSADFRRVGGLLPLPHLFFSDVIAWFRIAQSGGKVCSPSTLSAFRSTTSSAGSMATLVEMYDAIRQYWAILDEAGYLAKPDHQVLARRFLSDFFTSRLRVRLVDLMGARSPAQFDAYKQTRTQLDQLARQYPIFPLCGWQERVYDAIVRLPIPALRQLLQSGVVGLRNVKKHRVANQMKQRGMI